MIEGWLTRCRNKNFRLRHDWGWGKVGFGLRHDFSCHDGGSRWGVATWSLVSRHNFWCRDMVWPFGVMTKPGLGRRLMSRHGLGVATRLALWPSRNTPRCRDRSSWLGMWRPSLQDSEKAPARTTPRAARRHGSRDGAWLRAQGARSVHSIHLR